MPWNDYSYTENQHAWRPGIYRCMILAAEQTKSNASGNPMLKITLRPSGTSSKVYAYIVGNDYFDENFSRFLDAFPQLKEQNFTKDNCFSFRGAVGCVKLVLDDNGFFKAAKYPWIPPGSVPDLPAFKWYYRNDEPVDPPEFLSAALEELPPSDEGTLPF
ncbi:MAG: hypothetical protein Q4F31_09420 [Eubacteriales bacterium]|nr:hypothetical protein [Eubacteriales bacterium]